jgi:hypothetical protein
MVKTKLQFLLDHYVKLRNQDRDRIEQIYKHILGVGSSKGKLVNAEVTKYLDRILEQHEYVRDCVQRAVSLALGAWDLTEFDKATADYMEWKYELSGKLERLALGVRTLDELMSESRKSC